jgi:hypothetical protein
MDKGCLTATATEQRMLASTYSRDHVSCLEMTNRWERCQYSTRTSYISQDKDDYDAVEIGLRVVSAPKIEKKNNRI